MDERYCGVVGVELYTALHGSSFPLKTFENVQAASKDKEHLGLLVVHLQKHTPRRELLHAKRNGLQYVPILAVTKNHHYIDVLARDELALRAQTPGKLHQASQHGMGPQMYETLYKELAEAGIIVVHRSAEAVFIKNLAEKYFIP